MSRDRDGFALIAVLWIVVLVAIVGLDFSLRARGTTRWTMNAADASIGRAAAEAGLVHAEARLIERLREAAQLPTGSEAFVDPWRGPGLLLTDTLLVGDARAVVRLRDAGTRLHLNLTSELELRRLMSALRVDDGQADRIAQAIADWRDLDDFRRARGAEREEYVRADAPVLPANGPFGSVQDVRHVAGMTDELFGRLSPHLTVHGSGRVNLASAPAEVLAALPWMSDGLLAVVLRMRARGPLPDLLTLTGDLDPEAREALQADLPALLSRVTTSTQEVSIESEGWRPGGAVRVRATAVAVRAGGAVFVTERAET